MSTVLVTGGSRGIGAAAVALFARRGDRVYFLYEKEDAAARQVSAETGATAIRCDVQTEKPSGMLSGKLGMWISSFAMPGSATTGL